MRSFKHSLVAVSLFGVLSSVAPVVAHADRISVAAKADIAYVPQIPVTREAVRAALVEARAQNLATFRAYVAGGVYPANLQAQKQLNVWRDGEGHYCAAATIIRASGNEELVERVAEQTNNIKLGDVQQGPLMSWILKSGFTQDEIAMIQEPFSPLMRRPGDGASVDLRAKETARLKVRYAAIDKALVDKKLEAKNLDAAVTRVMKNDQLTAELLAAAGQSLED